MSEIKYFVDGTHTGTGDREIRIIETSIDSISLEKFIYASDVLTAERYYFNEKFLISKK